MDYNEFYVMGLSALGAGIAMVSNFGPGFGQGIAAGQAAQAVGRNPGAVGDIRTTMLIGQAFAETSSLYGLIIAIILLIVQPFS